MGNRKISERKKTGRERTTYSGTTKKKRREGSTEAHGQKNTRTSWSQTLYITL